MKSEEQEPLIPQIPKGPSYEPDVRLLCEEFGIPEPGSVISYSEVEEVIKEKHGTSRFKGVTDSWRTVLGRYKVVIDCVRGVGFRVVPHNQRAGVAFSQLKSGEKKVKKAAGIIASTDTSALTEAELKKHDNNASVINAINNHIREELRVESLPKVRNARQLSVAEELRIR